MMLLSKVAISLAILGCFSSLSVAIPTKGGLESTVSDQKRQGNFKKLLIARARLIILDAFLWIA